MPTRTTANKHPFDQPYTLATILNRKAAIEFMSGKVTFETLHSLGIWSGKKNTVRGTSPSRTSCDWLEAATTLSETDQGIVAYIDHDDARQFKILRMTKLVLKEDGKGWESPDERLRQLGSHAVVIYNLNTFVLRLASALNVRLSGNCTFLADEVTYYNPTSPQHLISMFSKDESFSWQREFRFLFCETNGSDQTYGAQLRTTRLPQPITLDIGSVDDIAGLMTVREFIRTDTIPLSKVIPAMRQHGLLSPFERMVNNTKADMAEYLPRSVPSVVINPETGVMQKYEDVFGEGSAFVVGWQFQRPEVRIARGFSRQQWAEAFLDGHLYMSTLGFFWNNGNNEQTDYAEGACAEVPPDALGGFSKSFSEVQAEYVSIVPAGMQYCNVCCFMMQVASIADKGMGASVSEPLDTLDLGEYLVVIDNPLELTRRVESAAQDLGYKCVMGPVEYRERTRTPRGRKAKRTMAMKTHEPLSPDLIFPDGRPELTADMFVKETKYQNQMEWRIALFREERTIEAYTLEVGSLRDICHLVRRSELGSETIDALYDRSSWLSCEFYGNTTRENLRDSLIEFGEDGAYLIATVG